MYDKPIYSRKYGNGLILLAIIDILWLLYALYTAYSFTQQTKSEADIVISVTFLSLLAATVFLALINMFYVLHSVRQKGKRFILTLLFGCLAIAPVAYVVLT